MSFVDTSGFYACLVRRDDRHQDAAGILTECRTSCREFVTTDYTLDETATLLKMRGHGHLIDPFFDIVFDSLACHIEWMDAQRFLAVRRSFSRLSNHDYSFTDCFSFHVMNELHLKDALTKDANFREAGFHPLLITDK